MPGLGKRKKIRYKPDRLEFALIMFDGDNTDWQPDEAGLIIDESALAGAQLVLKSTDACKKGDRVMVKLGQMDPILGEVVWHKDIDKDLIRIGVNFLE